MSKLCSYAFPFHGQNAWICGKLTFYWDKMRRFAVYETVTAEKNSRIFAGRWNPDTAICVIYYCCASLI
jgi:hypothetical protein